MDIAALSMTLSQVNVRQEANVSVMKKVMDQAESNGQGVIKMLQESNTKAMELSVQPHIGSNIDSRG
ncbi:YjfB family protein [Planococcus lenghuensis]|uniref:Putative motility protein n=1 Tax=Planococcus lenghuensis TaxID=2213202 RepID=A0A1Q2L2N5_9BACL|nr:YjfB family protein [Planococcus lenghuensis]AQQ54152.1 putative motility protein [Planococcus lenghuensis]